MYEYKSIEVKQSSQKGETFNQCMEIVQEHAKEGWRLVQIVIPPNEKTGVMTAYAYMVILEKRI